MRRSGFLGLLLLLLLATPAFAAEWPAPIAAAIAERAKSCAEAGGKLAPPEKAIRRLDLDGDGRDDFILDDRRLACSRGAPGWCGLRRLLDRGVPVERRRRLEIGADRARERLFGQAFRARPSRDLQDARGRRRLSLRRRLRDPDRPARGAELLSRLDATAIVVAHDSEGVLPACLAALERDGVPTLVVDNASADRSAAVAEERSCAVLRIAQNEGYGRAANLGARACETPFILIMNPDIVLDAGAVPALLQAAERYQDAGMLAPRIVEPDDRFFFQPRSLLSPYLSNPGGKLALPEGDCCAPFLSGACFLVRRDLFLRLGGFDPNIFLFYEDDDLCRRIADAGHALIHVHGAVARHARGSSTAPRPGRIFRARWHHAWSRAYVSRKYGLPDPAARMLVLNALKTVLALFSFRRSVVERYAGSAAGALASLVGRTALGREGLAREDTR